VHSGFLPSHAAPAGGLTAWAVPDPRAPAVATIEARVEMRILQVHGDWAYIECNNGWTAWVDARRLMPITASSAGPPGPRDSVLTRPLIRLGQNIITLRELVPAAGLVLGALLPWLSGSIGSGTSFDIPLLFLIDTQPGSTAIKLGFVLSGAALIVLAAPLVPVRLAAFALAFAACVLYAIQLQRVLNEAQSNTGVESVIGYGTLVTAVAAGVGGVGCLMSRRT
jgi:hypothetical protein